MDRTSDVSTADPRPKRPRGIVVRVVEADYPPVDLAAWAERYVALLLRVDAEAHGEHFKVTLW